MDVRMPDGAIITNVPDDITQTELLRRYQLYKPERPAFVPPPEDPGFFKALGTGITSTAKSLLPGAQLMVNPEDREAAARMQQVQDEAQNAFRRTQFSDIGERAKAGDVGGALGATWDKFKELAGESIGFQVPAAGAGLAAAGAAALAPAALPAAAIGTAAYGVTLLGQYITSNLGRQIEENKGKPVERLPAAVAGTGQAALDLLGGKFLGLGKILGLEGKKASEMALKELTEAAANPIKYKRAVATGAAKGIALEMPQEVTQSVLERWQAGLEIDPFKDPSAAKEYAEAAAGALMLGGPLGAVGQVGAARVGKAEAEEEYARREAARVGAISGMPGLSRDITFGTTEAPAPLEEKDQMALLTAPKAETPGVLSGMAPSGAQYTQSRDILGSAEQYDAQVAELQGQKAELERVGGILQRELQRATTSEQQVTQQQRLAQVNTELETVNSQLADLGEKGPTKRETKAAAKAQGQLDFTPPKPAPIQYPAVPAVPQPVGLQLDENTTAALFAKPRQAKNRALYKKLLGLDLTKADDLQAFEIEVTSAPGLNQSVVSDLIDEARSLQFQRKTRLSEPRVIGEQLEAAPERQVSILQPYAKPVAPGLEVQREQARLQQQGPSPLVLPETRERQVGGRPLLAPVSRPKGRAKSPAQQPAEPWMPSLVTGPMLDRAGVPKATASNTARAVRAAVEGKDLDNEGDAHQVWEALSAFRDRATTTKNQREKINQFLMGAGLMDQPGLDFTTPQETPRATRPEAAGEGVGVPVLGPDTGRPGAATDGAPAVARGQGPAAQTDVGAKQTPVALNASGLADEYIKADTEGRGTDRFDIYKQLRSQSPDNLFAAISDTRAQRQALLSKDGRPPNRGSPKAALWNQLSRKDELLTSIWSEESKRAPKKSNATTDQQQIGKVKAALRKAGYSAADIDAIIKERSDPVTGLDLTSIGELLELGTKPVGAKLGDKAAAAIQAGDLRGALRAIAESGSTPLMREVAKKLLGKVGNTRIELGTTAGAGQYNPVTDTITISPDGMHEHTLLHEMLHAAISHVLRNRFHPLTQQLAKLYQQIAPRLQGQYGAKDVQEFAAEAQTNPEFRASLQSIPLPQGVLKTAWDHFVSAVRKFLGMSPRQSKTALDKIDTLLNDLLASADVEPRTPGDILFSVANVSGSPKAYAKFLNGMGKQASNLPEMSQGWKDATSTLERGLTSALTKTMDLNQLSEIYADRVPALRDMLNGIGQRRGFENTQHATLSSNLLSLEKLRRDTKPGEWQTLEDVVTDSTIAMYDPTNRSRSGMPDAPEGPAIQRAYNSMSDELKKAYSTIKDHYLDLFKNYKAALEKDLLVLPADERQKILDAIDSRIKPYFPLMRFGDYFLRFERDGETVTMAFESPEVRNAFIASENIDRKAPGFRSFQSLEEVLSRPPSDPMIQRTLKALRDNGADQAVVGNVHRALLQLYPKQSAIMNMIKRKNAPGFEQDVVRGYATLAPKLISQTASRMYNRTIEDAASNARIELENLSGSDPRGFDPMADELARELSGEKNSRLDVTLNPSMGSIAQSLNWMTYGFHMGANVSSAIVELTSTPMIAYPLLGGRYGFGKAFSALTDASKEYGKLIFKDAGKNFQTHHYLSTVNTVPPGHKYHNLIKTLQARGVTNVSVAQEIMDTQAARGGTMSKLRRNIGTALGIMHHHAGMANREITAMAAYDLAKKAGKSEEQAIDYAIKTTVQAHGSGMIETAGTIFQHPVGRVILMFKRYAQNMMFLMARTVYVATKGDNTLTPEEQVMARSIARKQLAGMFVMAYAFAGAQGRPFYGMLELIHDALDAAFGDDEDPQDFNLMVRNAIGEMNYKGPFGALTGMDIAQRTGFGDLILRDDSRTKAELGPVRYYVEQLLGAPMGMVGNIDRGFRMINEGYWERGLEAMSPAVLRNVFKANRYAIEGATTLKGDPILDDISMTESLFQLAGFAPTRLSEIYARRGAAEEMEQAIQNRKNRLLDQYEMARDSGDDDALEAVQDKIARYNELVPEYPITAKTIRDSIEGRRKREAQALYGVQINPKLKEKIRRTIEGEE